MKLSILIYLLFVGLFCSANMASPLSKGTMSSAAFTSKDINILSERIYIKIDKDFRTAKFMVEYTIQSDAVGQQIPLLFFAKDYKDSFFVWVDNQRVAIQNIPQQYTRFANSPFSGFSNLGQRDTNNHTNDEVAIFWEKNSAIVYKMNDLKYFETHITKGTHIIRVEYTANAWFDRSDWIKKYSFRYSLAPAKFWKSFGTLNIQLEQEGTVKQLSTNIGLPLEQTIQSKNSWTFNQLPDTYLEFSYTPSTNNLATTLLRIEPFGISIITGLLLFVLHVLFILSYRRKFVAKKYSPVVIWGSFLVPLLILLSYLFSFDMIDHIIGADASKYHGYVFLVLVLYPILVPVYWVIAWLIDKLQKKRLMSQ